MINLKIIKGLFLQEKGQLSEMIDGLIKLNYSFHFTEYVLLTVYIYIHVYVIPLNLYFSNFLMMQPFVTVAHVVVTSNHKIVATS